MAALDKVCPDSLLGEGAAAQTQCPYADAAAALRRATAIADSYGGSDAEQIRFGMWMGLAESWRHLAQLQRTT